ncbi:sigma-70 family RNA polymerase sigma factor [Methylomonas sp. AM2-LC]|uniref:sigma-70 family RNA polymerase sigma factor n=1 Tax=Methylomonas sp. AM2-LC TaxID=3153301 RepID=UPI003265DC21
MPETIRVLAQQIGQIADSEAWLLAVELEQARRQLCGFLMENAYTTQFIAEQLALPLQKGSASYALSVAEAPLLQRRNQIDSILPPAKDTEQYQHLLPLFLIRMATLLITPTAKNPLNADEKQKLFCYCSDLQKLRQRMINANIGLTAFVAHKYRSSQLGVDELMQEGMLGLIKAVDRFDPERGVCFSTYAIYWIRQAVTRLIFNQDKIVRLPIQLAEKASSVFEAMRNSYIQNERWPTHVELMQLCALSAQDIQTISSYYQATHSLDEAVFQEDDSGTLLEKLEQQQFDLPLDELIKQSLMVSLDQAVSSLPEKQAAILTMRFGLHNQTEMTLQAIANQLNLTRERVRQIQNEALKKLYQQFGNELLVFLETNESSQ